MKHWTLCLVLALSRGAGEVEPPFDRDQPGADVGETSPPSVDESECCSKTLTVPLLQHAHLDEDATFDCFDIGIGASLTVGAGTVLTIKGCGPSRVALEALLILEGPGSAVKFEDSHRIRGAGQIWGLNTESAIAIAGSSVLTSDVFVTGSLMITQHGTAPATFWNKAKVWAHLDTDQIIFGEGVLLEDTADSVWQAGWGLFANCGSLVFQENAPDLLGQIFVEQGGSQVLIGATGRTVHVTTEGDLKMQCGTDVFIVSQGSSLGFGDFVGPCIDPSNPITSTFSCDCD
jgi:hypothetical protein